MRIRIHSATASSWDEGNDAAAAVYERDCGGDSGGGVDLGGADGEQRAGDADADGEFDGYACGASGS